MGPIGFFPAFLEREGLNAATAGAIRAGLGSPVRALADIDALTRLDVLIKWFG